METLLAALVGVVFAAGVYLLLRRSLIRVILGLMLLGNAVNLLIFTAGRVTRGNPPLVPEGAAAPVEPYADPVAQALILTAIVISFGLVAFALAVVYRVYKAFGTVDTDALRDEPP